MSGMKPSRPGVDQESVETVGVRSRFTMCLAFVRVRCSRVATDQHPQLRMSCRERYPISNTDLPLHRKLCIWTANAFGKIKCSYTP